MIVRIIDVYVREEDTEAFRQATLENRAGSIREPGVLRFDVLQVEAEPTHFLLFEVYRDEQATLDHKETAHYKAWRQAVEPMMAKPRGSTACTVVAPQEPREWRP
ncbi:MAG: antibiotic biosynthesis monooxygenase [Spirochaetales bacterium]|nr:antibiotic biosynthesis monooxygenase [Spirochaetales bacterium]